MSGYHASLLNDYEELEDRVSTLEKRTAIFSFAKIEETKDREKKKIEDAKDVRSQTDKLHGAINSQIKPSGPLSAKRDKWSAMIPKIEEYQERIDKVSKDNIESVSSLDKRVADLKNQNSK